MTRPLKRLPKQALIFVPIDDISKIRRRWHESFTRGISEETLEKLQYGQSPWHIFDYQMCAFLAGDKVRKSFKYDSLSKDEAKRAFNDAPKDELYLFFHEGKGGYLLKNAHLLLDKDFDWKNDAIHYDAYLYDAAAGWTFARDHEYTYYFATLK